MNAPAFAALAGLVLKATLLLVAGAAVAGVLRRRPAAWRHFAWTLVLAGAAALALLQPLAPRLELPLAPAPPLTRETSDGGDLTPFVAAVALTAARGAEAAPVPAAMWRRAALASSSLAWVWLLGSLAVALRCALGHLGLARLARAATPLATDGWPEQLAQAAADAGVARPVRLRRSATVGMPVTWGFWRPVVLLPADAGSWPRARRRAVLLHELAHVARGDYLAQLTGLTACALYWFHPAAWMALGRLRREAERACDDQVLAAGTPAPDYAGHLLDVARGAGFLRLGGLVSIGMARRSTLEGRLLAVLDEGVSRQALAARARLAAAAALAAFLVPLAGLTLVARAQAGGDHRSDGVPAGEPQLVRSLEVAPGERLRLDLETGGSVDIRGWDERRVEVRAWAGGLDASRVRFAVEREGGGVVVRSSFPGGRGSWSSSNSFAIRVPRRFDVQIESAGGDVAIADVEGTFAGGSGGGDLLLERLAGRAELSTGGGDIRVRHCDLDGAVATGGGQVTLSQIRGGLRGSSGSGPVLYVKPAGVLHVTKAGGEIVLDEAPAGAVVSTGGGAIAIGRAAGVVDASTGGGDIEIGPVAGSVRAETGAGDVEVTVVAARGEEQTVEISSGKGDIVLLLPADFDGTFELEAAYTQGYGRVSRVDVDWPLARETTSAWDGREGTPRRYERARGAAGAGRGRVWVKTVNGNIEVRRGGS